MRHQFIPRNNARIGALQDDLLSVDPRFRANPSKQRFGMIAEVCLDKRTLGVL